jgi:MFS family permease
MGDLKELFHDRRWRYHTVIGVTLAMAGVMGLWGVGFWMPELVRNNVLKDMPKADQDHYASLAMFLQNFGAFFGIYAFSLLTGVTNRRVAFAVALVLGLAATMSVFGFMTEKSQIWWMVPLLGFCTLMIFGGYAIYFPELYPTRLRSTGIGFCYNVARYLAAAAPFILGKLAGLFTAPKGTERGEKGLSDFTLLSSLGSEDSAFRYAALTVAMIFVLGLLILPFAPETKGKPLPE